MNTRVLMKLIRSRALFAISLLLQLSNCNYSDARGEYDRHLKVCSTAESNGLLDAAVQACSQALITDNQVLTQAETSDLLYRLGCLQRQQEQFKDAEMLIRRSLTIEQLLGNQEKIPSRLIELALNQAGQDLWLEGAYTLKHVVPLLERLSDSDRKAVASAFKLFSVRLELRDHSAEAKHFRVDFPWRGNFSNPFTNYHEDTNGAKRN
jgi:hypothetical protein